MLKNKIFVSISRLIFSIVLFFFCVSFFNFKTSFATEGYLEYCGKEGGDWNNYPYKPSSTSFTCLNKRYCSDLKRRKINIGDFDRYGNEFDGHTFDEIKTNSTVSTIDGECDTNNEIKEIITDASGLNFYKVTTKMTTGLEGSYKCKTTVVEPIIFRATPEQCAEGCLELTDLDGNYILNNGNKIKYRPPVLINEAANNCLLKSCADIRVDEYEAIYQTRYLDDKANFKQFCFPYKYNGNIKIDNRNIKYMKGIRNFSDYIENGIIKEKNDDSIYCHEFENVNYLPYLLKEGDAFDIDGNLLDTDSPLDKNKLYHCRLANCPVLDGLSMTCPTNYYLFEERSDDYILSYEKNILKNMRGLCPDGSDDCELNFNTEAEYKEALENAKKNIDEYVRSNPKRALLCSPFSCSKIRGIQIIKINNENSANKSKCDEFSGLDKNLVFYKNEGFDYNKVASTLPKQEIKNEDEICYKTIDCALDIYKNDKSSGCIEEKEDGSNIDKSLSYFYKPIPNPSATEVLTVDKNIIEDPQKLSDTIYRNKAPFYRSNGEQYDILNDSRVVFHEDKKISEENKMNIVAIKRLLNNGLDDVKLFNRDGGLYTNQKKPKAFGTWEEHFKRKERLKDYFREDKVCANTQNDFKTYGYYGKHNIVFWSSTRFWYGEYYNGFWRASHVGKIAILPICNIKNSGVYGEGRAFFCGAAGKSCTAPEWTSYYIKGDPTFKWKQNEADIESFEVTACLRSKSSSELGACGARECRVDCGAGICKVQWCGFDKCVDLKFDGTDCSLEGLREGDNWNEYKGSAKSGCAKKISDGVRFRVNRAGRNLVVFLDIRDDNCLWNGYIEDTKRIRRNAKRRGDGTYPGKLDELSLLDSNELIDYNNDGIIDDKDVFGEELFKVWNCNSNDLNKRDPNCDNFIAGNGSNASIKNTNSEPVNNWLTWDVVQYIGNNQPTNSLKENCRVGSLKNCRGFYDKDGNFLAEQQNFIIPLTTSPDFFYKYATQDNSPDLFLPLLLVSAFKNSQGIYRPLISTPENEILVDFFNPSLTISYGTIDKNDGIPFEKNEVLSNIETLYNGDKVKTQYKLEKISRIFPTPEAKICLSQVLSDGTEQEIKCLKRGNPNISNFVLKPVKINTREPYVNAYFSKENLKDIPKGTKLNLNNKDLFIVFYDNYKNLNSDENKKLKESAYAYGQNYPIYFKKSYCSDLNYSCIFYKKELENCNNKLSGNIDSNNNTLECDSARLSELNSKIKECDNNIEPFCSIMNGSPALVQKTIKNGNKNDLLALRFKTEYDKDGGFNEMCVTKGFEDFEYYVKALKMKDAVGDLYLGKCVLDDESKKKPECRLKGYYAFCSDKDVDGCVCLDGTDDCDCSIKNNCTRAINCQCSGEDCLKLPEACFLSGVNNKKNKLNYESETTYSCDCIFVDENDGNIKNDKTYEIRKATPRELGLCVDLMSTNFCDPLKYYDQEKNYSEGGDGETIDIIDKTYRSNIWRTQQKVYGKYTFGDLGHAEFDKTNDCESLSDELKKDFCLSKQYTYNEDTGTTCNFGSANSKCKTIYANAGTCNGFWKNRENVIPLAKCVTKKDSFTGEEYGMFEIVPNTGCERYTCPSIADKDVILDDEISLGDISETSANTVDRRGLFNGFAAWSEYKKGSYGISDDAIIKDNIENKFGDNIEEVNALHCIQGYGPSGLNVTLDKYMPAITSTSAQTNYLNKEDEIIKNMVGHNLNEPRRIYFDNEANYNLAKTKYIENKRLYDAYSIKTNYYAKKHLPSRYCSQLGNWLGVNDIYSRYKILNDLNPNKKVPLYSKNNSILHNIDNNNGFLSSSAINSLGLPANPKNTYGNNVDYAKKFCERLYCREFDENDVGLLSVEDSSPSNELKYDNTTLDNLDNKYYPNEPSYYNYPKNPKNYYDNRINIRYNNKYTVWRHAGGASWEETPAPRDATHIRVSGQCVEKRGFFPHDTTFLPSFDQQYASIFDATTSSEKNIKDYSLKMPGSFATQPTRVCSKWGQWNKIENRCVPTCEALDPFRTDFSDINNTTKVENYEINKFYKTPKYRSNYLKPSSASLKYGDIYTGGAKWPRTKVGTYVIGECDATVGKNNNISGFPSKGIQFIRSANKNTIIPGTSIKTNGAPYRECLTDGTWGEIKDPCVNLTTCSDYTVNYPNLGISNINITLNKTVGVLLGGSISYDEIKDSNIDNNYGFEVQQLCNREIFKNGIISRVCNFSTGNWDNNIKYNCELITCSGNNEEYGVYNKNIGIPADKYYLKSSGLKGVLSISPKNYSGYIKEEVCPIGYLCEGCESNKVSYTCDLNSERLPTWSRKGNCKIKTCGAKVNDPYGVFEKYFNISAGQYYTKSSGMTGQITIGGNIYKGYSTGLSCPTGYTCVGCSANQITYTCDLDGTGNAVWSRQGSCQLLTCLANNTSYGVYNTTINILSGKYYTKTSGLSGLVAIAPSTYEGHTKEVSCPDAYTCINCVNNNKVSYTCDLNTSQSPTWTSRGGCKIKTCGAITNDSYGVYQKYFSVAAGKYYSKKSGHNGKITIDSITYDGHTAETSCPTGYACVGCVNNKVTYTCSSESVSGTPEWTKQGNCQIMTCPANNTSYGVANVTIGILAGKYYVKSTTSNGPISIGSNKYEGYLKEVSCPTGYKCTNCDNDKVSYTCDLNSSGVAYWNVRGSCVPQLCLLSSLTDKCSGAYHCKISSKEEQLISTKTFSFTGSQQSFVVPNGVNKLKLEAWGSAGGYPYEDEPENSPLYGRRRGGYSFGNLKVIPGEKFYVYVGGKNGYNGGGISDMQDTNGGGATDIRYNGDTLSNRIIVAGGGGGAATSDNYGKGYGAGGGGNSSGAEACDVSPCCGDGGKLDSGGYIEEKQCLDERGYFQNDMNGTFGNGGAGYSAGGGGGGWYGGASSGHDELPGAGGSGYLHSSLTETGGQTGVNNNNGVAKISAYNSSNSAQELKDSYMYASVLDLECETGYASSGGIKATCGANATWNVSGSCAIKTCSASSIPSKVANSLITNWYKCPINDKSCTSYGTQITSSSAVYNYGTYVYLNTCPTGYTKSGTTILKCTDTNTWTVTTSGASCQKDCDIKSLSLHRGSVFPTKKCLHEGNYPNCCMKGTTLTNDDKGNYFCVVGSVKVSLPNSAISTNVSGYITEGSVVANRFFSNNAKVKVSCSNLYIESSSAISGGYTTSQMPWNNDAGNNIGYHYYVCDNSKWKSVGSCVRSSCDIASFNTFKEIFASKTNNSLTNGYVEDNKYFADRAMVDATCDTGFTESPTNILGGYNSSERPWSSGGNHYYICEKGVWKTVGRCVGCVSYRGYSEVANITINSGQYVSFDVYGGQGGPANPNQPNGGGHVYGKKYLNVTTLFSINPGNAPTGGTQRGIGGMYCDCDGGWGGGTDGRGGGGCSCIISAGEKILVGGGGGGASPQQNGGAGGWGPNTSSTNSVGTCKNGWRGTEGHNKRAIGGSCSAKGNSAYGSPYCGSVQGQGCNGEAYGKDAGGGGGGGYYGGGGGKGRSTFYSSTGGAGGSSFVKNGYFDSYNFDSYGSEHKGNGEIRVCIE